MDLLEELKNRQEYKAFMKTRKHRAILVSIILLIFWLCLIYANNPSTSRSQKFVLFMILALSTALDIRIIHSSFFTKPRILKGTIIDTKLVLNDSGHRYNAGDRKRLYTKLYKIHTQQGDMWGESAKSYVESTYYVKDAWGEDTLETNKLNNELEIHDGLKINDNVVWFSFENNSFGSDGYIIKEN